uniref:SecD/SecF/SecDF export membrane protein n=1 Tax=uncultured organism TaxID=155900 RepID=M1PQT1_9ZZZZ|nr:SecD/SecF/SecDF export membrane protein [uncultured organism]
MDIGWHMKNLSPKQMIIIPLVIGALLGSFVIYHTVQYDSFVPFGMEFSGGTQIEINDVENMPTNQQARKNIEKAIEEEFGTKVEIELTETGARINTTIDNLNRAREIENFLRDTEGITGRYNTPQFVGSELTGLYREQAQLAGIAAAIAISIIVFIAFRNYTTIGGILSVLGLDLVGIFGAMVILNIPLTLASMGGILLIIGYGIDDNVLLYSRALKQVGGDVTEKAISAMKTGLTMAITSGSALLALYIVTDTPALEQIASIIIIGIILDALNTWFFNAGNIIRNAKKNKGEYHGKI